MLNIPNEIKQALKSAGVYKNFRVHFPNGERADIINEQIIRESVSFQESICSQDKLKLGLCESPVIEFETMGIENLTGKNIDCFIEIACEDTVTGAVYKADLGRYIYAIPLGSFSITKSEKQDSRRRRNTGYSIMADYTVNFNYAYKLFLNSSFGTNTNLRIRYDDLIALSFPNKDDITTPVVLASKSNVLCTEQGYVITPINVSYQYYEIAGNEAYYEENKIFHNVVQYRVDGNIHAYTERLRAFFNDVVPLMKEANQGELFYQKQQGASTIIAPWDEKLYMQSAKRYRYLPAYAHERLYTDNIYHYTLSGILREDSSRVYDFVENEETKPYYVDEIGAIFNGGIERHTSASGYEDFDHWHVWESVRIPVKLTVVIGSETYTLDCTDLITSVYKNEIENAFNLSYSGDTSLYIQVKRTKAKVKNRQQFARNNNPGTLSTVTRTEYKASATALDKIDLRKFIEGYVELMGCMGRISRSNTFELIHLNDFFSSLYPSEILYPSLGLYPNGVNGGNVNRSNYKTLKYEDSAKLPYGAVEIAYNEDDYDIMYLPGYDDETDASTYQVYTVEGNYWIEANTFTEQEIEAYLTNIANGLVGVQYMPSNIEMIGRPDIEAGDVLEVHADNETFITMVLNRSLTGIQTLWDAISAR